MDEWIIKYAIERTAEVAVDNFNDACEMAKEYRREGERVVSIKLKR